MSSPNKIEEVVLGIIEEFLAKKTFSAIEDIVVFVNNRVRAYSNINRNRIELIIKDLIKKRVIIPGTKLMKNNIIENEKRKKVLNYIQKNPGSNINEIMRANNLGSNLALWHLSTLEKFRFIRSVKFGNKIIFFPYDSNPNYDKIYFYMKNDIIQEIITLLKKESKPLKITDIATMLKKNHYTIKKYIEILVKIKIVDIKKDKSRNIYQLNKERLRKIIRILNKK
ncbi:MAG: winged helix-turn-helix transcriptional regulator [Promethearchaeota archaeon]